MPVETGEYERVLSQIEREKKMGEENLSAAISALRVTAESAFKQGAEILAEVRTVKEKVGEQAISIGQLQRDHQYHAQAIAGLERQNKEQETRLRAVEQKPERAKSVDEDLKETDRKLDQFKKELSDELGKVKTEIIKAQTLQRMIGWGINLVAGGGIAAIFEWFQHRPHP